MGKYPILFMRWSMEDKFDEIIKYYAAKYNLDWLLLKAQIKQESNFNPEAINRKSMAMGLAQFMLKTWLEWEDETVGIQDEQMEYNPFEPEQAIRVQAAYINWLRKQIMKLTAKDMEKWILAAYNWGIGNVTNLLKAGVKFNDAVLPAETSNYVRNIMKFYDEYNQMKIK